MGDKRSDMGFQSENKKEKTNDDNDQNQCYETMSCDEKQSQPWNKSDSRNRSQNEQNPNLSKNALAVAEPPNDESSARMFTLNIDCLEELFEWLSIKDLFTLRQTFQTVSATATATTTDIRRYCGDKLQKASENKINEH
ncbi:uncharacterized protein LOC129567026 isoform X2 [Sitodiplosis mosellana]|uniref:uncharacterized protein LOC129567026 isoform X2 n=1 Tax=Sitodiplosis mosellana TaxID=263140 RepID=UPI002443BD63|nr:uncharacterized protein LOC129567026 isoform X2 [Sitodiplosis mosellana]